MIEVSINASDLHKAVNIPIEPGKSYLFTIKTKPSLFILEFIDKMFQTNSAVILPEREDPSNATGNDAREISAVGMVATTLRYVFEHPEQQIIVAGHTDTAGNYSYNSELSQMRAETVLACLTGNSARFSEICSNRRFMTNTDYNQILAWLSEERGFECHPGAINENGNDLVVNKFRVEYNKKGPGSRWAPKLTEWGGASGNDVWVGYFNCYEEYLMEELGVEQTELSQNRSALKFKVSNKWVGCNEYHPRIAENLDEFPCDSNRRVEVMFFDSSDQTPEIACDPDRNNCNKAECSLYKKSDYSRVILPPMATAKTWKAYWDKKSEPATINDNRKIIVDAPGLPSGETVTIEIFQQTADISQLTKTLSVLSKENRIDAQFNGWYNPELIKKSDTGDFPEAAFSFKVNVQSRLVASGRLPYRDVLNVKIQHKDTSTPFAKTSYLLVSPWGTRNGTTDDDGQVPVTNLPPGGASVIPTNYRLQTY